MPIDAELEDHLNITKRDSVLQKFQQNYKRLFVSAPMASSGWAIWKNQP